MNYRFDLEKIKKNYDSLLVMKKVSDRELYNATLEFYNLFFNLVTKQKSITNTDSYRCSDFFRFLKIIINGDMDISSLAIFFEENLNVKLGRKELIDLFKDLEKKIPLDVKSLSDLDIDLDVLSLEKSIKYKKRIIDLDEVKDRSYQLFSSINPKFVKDLDYVYNNSLIHILTKKENKKIKTCDAAYYDSFNKIPYIIITNNNTCDFFDTFNHELCHTFEYMRGNFDNKLFLLDEANAIFISFLTNYLGMEDVEFLKAFYNYYLFNKENFAILKTYDKIKTMDDLSSKSIRNNLKNNLGISINLKTFFNSNIKEVYTYATSMIVALYLLEIYKQDQDKAFYLFNKSIELNNPSYEDYFKMIGFDYLDKDYVNSLISSYDSFFDKELTRRRIK